MTTELLKKLEAHNVKLMDGNAKEGALYSLAQLQVLMTYVLDGTMTPQQMREHLEEKLA